MNSITTNPMHVFIGKSMYTELKAQATAGTLYIAYGKSVPTSSTNLNNLTKLQQETARVQVAPENVVYLKEISSSSIDEVSTDPTQFIRVDATLTKSGTYKEWGLFSDATSTSNSGKMLIYQYIDDTDTNPDSGAIQVGVATTFSKYIYIQV